MPAAGPWFSVVITFHNQYAFARATLDSILGERRDGLEIIAVDDGSSDGTQNVLLEYGNAIRTVLLERDHGASIARSRGAAVAVGDYLVFLDGDDAFLPWGIDVYEAVVRLADPVVIIGQMRWFEGEIPDAGPSPSEVRFVEYDDYFGKDRATGISASAIVIKRRSYEEVGGWGNLFPAEDYDLLFKLGASRRVIQILEPATTLHRAHDRQTIQNTSLILDGIATLAARERSGAYPGGRRRALERRATIGGCIFFWARVALKRGSYRHATRLLLRNWTFVIAAVSMRLSVLVKGRRPARTIQLHQAGEWLRR